MIKEIKKQDIDDFLETAKALVTETMDRMEQLGVDRLGPVYIKTWHNQTHGAQQRLHIDGDEYEGNLIFCRKADNDHSKHFEYGDFNLPFVYPDIETVIRFVESVDEINSEIAEIENRIKRLTDSNPKIN